MFRSMRGPRAALSLVVLAVSAIAVPFATPAPAAAAPTPQPGPILFPGVTDGATEVWGGIGGRVVFSGDTLATGQEPFVYDEGTNSVSLLQDLVPGSQSSGAQLLARLGDRFLVVRSEVSTQLWATDGTSAGTELVKNLGETGFDTFRGAPILDGFAYFYSGDVTTGTELWRTDGTTAGTTMVAELSPGADSTQFGATIVFAGKLYFVASVSGGPFVLWRTDGTAVGTVVVEPTLAGTTDLSVAGGSLVFGAEDAPGSLRRIVYRTDGTPGAATPLQEDGSRVYDPNILATTSGPAYFSGTFGPSGPAGLWTTDGTSAGTVELRRNADGFVIQSAVGATYRGETVFVANDFGTGSEMWTTDGTPAGTRPLEIVAGSDGGARNSPPVVHSDGWLYFSGFTPGALTVELYRTDGTTVESLTAGAPFTQGFAPVAIGDRIYFAGRTPAEGTELWYVDAPPPVPSVAGTPVATAGTLSASVTWSASTALPAAPVTGYTVTAAPGGATCTTTGALTCTVSGLSAGVSYTFTVVATNRVGSSAASAVSNAVVPTAPPMASVTPGRILETRVGEQLKTIDGLFQGIGRRAAGSTLELDVAGRSNVAADASAVMLNVTAVAPGADGFVTVFPCGVDRPNASSVNFRAGQVVPNAVLAKIGTGGKVCLFTTAETDLLVDVNGAVPAGGSPVTVSPARLLETRSGLNLDTVDGQFEGGGRLAAGGTLELLVAGRATLPTNASAVMLNVTAVAPGANGFVTVFPCGVDRPNASSVNYAAGQVVPNAVLAKVGTDGKVCLFSTAATDLLVDVSGYVPAGSSPSPLTPARLLETRSGATLTTVDGQFQGIGQRAAGSTLELLVAGRGNVPSGASSVMVNVTAVTPGEAGFLTVFPCGEDRPNASSVNYAAGQVVPNAVLAKIGTGGTVCIFTTAATDLLVDVTAAT